MSSTSSQKKAWLSPEGKIVWNDGHIGGGEKILGKSYTSSNLMRVYDDMFNLSWVRIDIDGIYLNYNKGGNLPTRSQLRSLKKLAIDRQLILFNLDSRCEVDLEGK